MDREGFRQTYGIIGKSPEMQEIIDVVQQVAPTDITVLISGESGTGKEVIAKAIHGESKRSKQALVSVNCGAIPEGLIESELFGHEKGAFTSAADMRRGYFEIADGGSILLDEIGEMPLSTQVKLLRVLESGEYMRVGSSVAHTTDTRVIAATNKLLEYEVQQKRFRPDLYFRLRSVNIHLPPLRNRKEDIPALVDQFVKETSDKNNIHFGGFTDDATELLMSYSWPGNIRELRNAIERAVLIESNEYIMPGDLAIKTKMPIGGRDQPEIEAEITPEQNNFEIKVPSHGVDFEDVEKQLLRIAMQHCHNNASAAARFLRMTRETLRYRLKKHGIKEYMET